MTELLNTLYVQTPGTSLHLDGDTVRVDVSSNPASSGLSLTRLNDDGTNRVAGRFERRCVLVPSATREQCSAPYLPVMRSAAQPVQRLVCARPGT